jgi:hypothetical protein
MRFHAKTKLPDVLKPGHAVGVERAQVTAIDEDKVSGAHCPRVGHQHRKDHGYRN